MRESKEDKAEGSQTWNSSCSPERQSETLGRLSQVGGGLGKNYPYLILTSWVRGDYLVSLRVFSREFWGLD